MNLGERICEATERLASRRPRVLVAIDGPDAAGKTTLADDLVQHLEVPWLRSSIDGFHQPQAIRAMRGALSPVGYFHDSFNYDALTAKLLTPFRTGEPRVCTGVFDWRADTPVEEVFVPVPERAILVFDGVFLLRAELRDLWDLSVYLRVRSSVVLDRALNRDVGVLGSRDEVRGRYEARYVAGQALYQAECEPERHADVLVDNSDFSDPVVIRW